MTSSSKLFFSFLFILGLLSFTVLGITIHGGGGGDPTPPDPNILTQSNFTLVDITANSSTEQQFNLTNNSFSSIGHVRLDNDSSGAILQSLHGARLLPLGFFSSDLTGAEFRANFLIAPNSTYNESFRNFYYGSSTSIQIRAGDVVALLLRNTTYATLFVKSVNIGVNATFDYIYNNQSMNNTFGTIVSGTCASFTNFSSCVALTTSSNCEWRNGYCAASGSTSNFELFHCESLSRSVCIELPFSCYWDATRGRAGTCVTNSSFTDPNGLYLGVLTCGLIGNTTFNFTNTTNFCNNQSFTQGTGLCTFDTTTFVCATNSTKVVADLPQPPVFSCDGSEYINNRTKCEILADHYFLPCGWDNVSNQCTSLFINFDNFKDFDDVQSDDTCLALGGNWRTENTYDPLTARQSQEQWCEFGTDIKTFSSVGGSAQSFTGNINQLSDCSRDCFACEYNSTGGRWDNVSVAQTQCTSSVVGCSFRNDSNAFNGHGWCVPSGGFGGASCDNFCGECNLVSNAQSACNSSAADCRWDNSTDRCIEVGEKSCTQDCFQCPDTTSCSKSPATGGCTWDSNSFVCTPKAGSYEICFDGIDNDNNALTDCTDFKCSSDPFCGGSSLDKNNCFQYDSFTYGSNTQANCTASSLCAWLTDDFGSSFCAPSFEQCWRNNTLYTNQTACLAFGGGGVCTFQSESECQENSTLLTSCVTQGSNQTACEATAGCGWNSQLSFCDVKSIVVCEMNNTLQLNQTACSQSGCVWQGDAFGGEFEGGFAQNCVSPCIDRNIDSATECSNATNTTGFFNGTCTWSSGRCEPQNHIGGCFENDGDYSLCSANQNCRWSQQALGGIVRHPNGSTNLGDALHSSATWLAVGLQRPNIGVLNSSIYIVNFTNQHIKLVMTRDAPHEVFAEPLNVSRLYCNATIIMEYNWTSSTCTTGTCNSYANSTCAGAVLHYHLNTTRGHLEALWEVNINQLDLSTKLGVFGLNTTATDTLQTATVFVDGNLIEYQNETALSNDGTNATRVRVSPGFCNDAFETSLFGEVDNEPPVPISKDPSGDIVPTSHQYLDFVGLGMKRTEEAYMYGTPTVNMSSSAICNGVPLAGGSFGSGRNVSKYYLYLDTNGLTTGSCSPQDNSTLRGFEYLFKYVGELDSNNRLSETLLTQKCSNSTWIASSLPFKMNKNLGCAFIGGPIFAIDKDALIAESIVNVSKSWRAYATSAADSGNTSNITDRVGPGSADFKGIDAELIDCSNPADKDNSQCSKFKQFGCFPGEFGPACKDSIDNDGDGATDCSDFDCVYDPFFCSGSFASIGSDESAPTILYNNPNDKLPTSLKFMFDTNEPSNGTIKYYFNDSTCATLNRTIYDKALEDGSTHTDYRPHHVAELTSLVANTTYFYKLNACDPTGNCVTSRCSNVTTAASHTNITFKLAIPTSWTVDIPSINLSSFSAQYAIKASTQKLQNINLTLNDTSTGRSITFVGLDVFEKQTLNVSSFLTGDTFLGLDANQYQSFKQKTGVERVIVRIPTTALATGLQHCDDSGDNCQSVTSTVNCTFSSDFAECGVPDAVGLGFSTYKTTTSSSSSDSGGSSGGGGGSGGGSATPVRRAEAADDGSSGSSGGGSSDSATGASVSDSAPSQADSSGTSESSRSSARGNLAGEATGSQGSSSRGIVWFFFSLLIIGAFVLLGVFLYHLREER